MLNGTVTVQRTGITTVKAIKQKRDTRRLVFIGHGMEKGTIVAATGGDNPVVFTIEQPQE